MADRAAVLVLLAVSTVAAPAAAASTSPSPPWEASVSIDGEPRTEASAALSVELTANRELDEVPFELELPPAVTADGGTRWEVSLDAGETATRSWQVSVDERGFWAARLAEPSNETIRRAECCLYAYSAPAEGQSGHDPEATIPQPRAATEVTFAALDRDTVEANYTVRRQAAWMRYGAFELRHSLGGEEAKTRAEHGARQAHHAFELPLAAGERETVFVASHVLIDFQGPGGEEAYHAFVHCRNIAIERTGEEVHRRDDWGCQAHRARGGRPTHAPVESGQAVPLGVLAVATALAVAGLAARRRETRR